MTVVVLTHHQMLSCTFLFQGCKWSNPSYSIRQFLRIRNLRTHEMLWANRHDNRKTFNNYPRKKCPFCLDVAGTQNGCLLFFPLYTVGAEGVRLSGVFESAKKTERRPKR